MFERPATRRSLLRASAGIAGIGAASQLLGSRSSATTVRELGSRPDPTAAAGTADASLPFDHVVIVMMENHSFDNYLGMLPRRGQPRADGFRFDQKGRPLNYSPLGNGYQRAFHLQGTCQPGGPSQSWNASHAQIDGGRMDGFAKTSVEAMGYWDESDLPFYYSLAKTFALGNRHFASVPAQTYPNRRFLYAGTASGTISTSNDGFTLPAPPNGTYLDALSRYGVSWKNYFTDLPATAIIPQTVTSHPTNYSPIGEFFLDAAAGTLPSVSFVDPEFGLTDIVGGLLFDNLRTAPGLPAPIAAAVNDLGGRVRSQGGDEENPQDIAIGEAFVSQVVNAVISGPAWPRTLLIWTYDEHGGYYDHIPPPKTVKPDAQPPSLGKGDVRAGYDLLGMRVPSVVVSPYSRPNAVTNVVHDHTSIYATIAKKWNLPSVTHRDAQANTLLDYLDLKRAPALLHPPALAAPSNPEFGLAGCRTTAAKPVIGPKPKGQRTTAAHSG